MPPSISKQKKVSNITSLLNTNKSFALVNISSIPGKQITEMRAKIKTFGQMIVSKNTFLKLSLQNSFLDKKIIPIITSFISGQCAIIFTNNDAISIFHEIEKTKTPTPAKNGQISPIDIIIKKGITSISPGPLISNLNKVGIQTIIESGKLSVKKEVTLLKQGEKISSEIAFLLPKFDIYPIILGLEFLVAHDENNLIYTKSSFSLLNNFTNLLQSSFQNALSLSLSIFYPTINNISFLLFQPIKNSIFLSCQLPFYTKTNIKILLTQSIKNNILLSKTISFPSY